MPICINCTQAIPYLYTVYQSANNLRLEQCPKCLNFADPYVEHDTLTLLLDLILLKRGVFRHILFNQGYEPRRALEPKEERKLESVPPEVILKKLEVNRRSTILRLGSALIFIDAFIRWSHYRTEPFLLEQDSFQPFLRVLAGCAIETVAFHMGVTLTSALTIRVVGAWTSFSQARSDGSSSKSGIHEEFRLSHVPLTLLYSSLTKLFLLFLLTLWKPSTSPRNFEAVVEHRSFLGEYADTTRRALEFLDDDKLNREWVVRNVLGGMAAGFGLRVVLDIKPVFTTIIVLTGWAVKTFVANTLHPWVNKGGSGGEVFLAYSIP